MTNVRHIYQFKPKQNPDGLVYVPQRDIAKIYNPMLREVFASLDEKNWSPDFKTLFKKNNVTQDDLAQATSVFLEAHRLFIRDRSVNSAVEAFVAAGVDRVNKMAIFALFSALGQVIAGGFFIALRDITTQGQLSSGHVEFVEMLGAGEAVFERLSGAKFKPLTVEKHVLAADVQEHKRVIAQLQDSLKKVEVEMVDMLQEQKRLAKFDNNFHLEAHRVRQAGFYMRLIGLLPFAYRFLFK